MTLSTVLPTKPGELDSHEKRGEYTISIIGCNPTGIFQACLLAEAGFKVVCADPNQTIIDLLAKGKTPDSSHETEARLKNHVRSDRLRVTNSINTAVSQSDVVILATSIDTDEKRKPDCSDLQRTSKLIGPNLRRGSLVIVTSTAGIGAAEGSLRETLENASGFKAGIDIGYAYSPIRIPPGQTLETMTSHERIVAATDKTSLNAALIILETIHGNNIRKTNNVRAAEAATLFIAAQQDTNSALANELALFCEKANLDYEEIRELAKTSASHSLPTPTLARANTDEESSLLSEEAEDLNVRLRMIPTATETNEEIIKHAVYLTSDALRHCGKTLRRARISMLGISSVPNEKGPTKRQLRRLIKMLTAKGARINLYDPYCSSSDTTEMQQYLKKTLNEAIEATDCVVITAAHDIFKRLSIGRLKIMMKAPAAIVDFEGILDPHKIEEEGFIYRGLGRGIWTK